MEKTPHDAPSHSAVARQTLTVDEAARMLGIGRNSAYQAVRQGQLYAIKLGRRLVVPRSVVERLLSGDAK